jgi:hypothetical protein
VYVRRTAGASELKYFVVTFVTFVLVVTFVFFAGRVRVDRS